MIIETLNLPLQWFNNLNRRRKSPPHKFPQRSPNNAALIQPSSLPSNTLLFTECREMQPVRSLHFVTCSASRPASDCRGRPRFGSSDYRAEHGRD